MKHLKVINFKDLFQRAEQFLFFALCLLLPIQTRFVFFTDQSHINGNYIFYNTAFVYFTDILLWLICGLFLFRFLFRNKQSVGNLTVSGFLLIFGFISAISVFVSHETLPFIQFFGLFKLILLIGLFCFTVNRNYVKQLINKIFWLILAISLFESTLSVWQYFNQQSFGLKLLGEEYLRWYLPGVAKFKLLYGYHWIFDQIRHVSHESLIMRPYGTFTHPNVLGAFMVFSALLSYYLFTISRETWKKVIVSLAIFLQILTITISFSRTAVVSWVIVSILWFILMFIMKHKQVLVVEQSKLEVLAGIVAISGLVCAGMFYPQYLERAGIVSYGTSNQEAISERVLYQKTALNMVAGHPIIGIGYQNFVNRMDEYSPVKLQSQEHQPVHNIYLLVAAETGLLGLLAFLGFIFLIIKKTSESRFNIVSLTLFCIFVGFLFMGLFDHYLLTIQQGRLMFFLTAGLLVASVARETGDGGLRNEGTEKLKN